MGKGKIKLKDQISLKLYDEKGRLKDTSSTAQERPSKMERILKFLERVLDNG